MTLAQAVVVFVIVLAILYALRALCRPRGARS